MSFSLGNYKGYNWLTKLRGQNTQYILGSITRKSGAEEYLNIEGDSALKFVPQLDILKIALALRGEVSGK